jgi:hypothetical protein
MAKKPLSALRRHAAPAFGAAISTQHRRDLPAGPQAMWASPETVQNEHKN